MVVSDMRRYGCVFGPVIAAVMCLVGCSRNAGPDAAREAMTTNMGQEEAKRTLSLERVMVPVTDIMRTAIYFNRTSPPPWPDGNYLTFQFRKVPVLVLGQEEEWAWWNVINIHAENFFEVTRRLGMDAVEVLVLHSTTSTNLWFPPAQGQEFTAIQDESTLWIPQAGGQERTVIGDNGYALITDARIPREWFLSWPDSRWGQGGAHVDQKTQREIRVAYPGSFRAAD